MPTIIILLSPNNLTIIGINKEGRNIAINFLFIGTTSLLTRAYNDAEKFKVQSINDFLIFVTQAIASLSAGWFVFNFGWEVVLLSTIPLLLLQLLLLLWWLRKKSH
jgi:MFS family permease